MRMRITIVTSSGTASPSAREGKHCIRRVFSEVVITLAPVAHELVGMHVARYPLRTVCKEQRRVCLSMKCHGTSSWSPRVHTAQSGLDLANFSTVGSLIKSFLSFLPLNTLLRICDQNKCILQHILFSRRYVHHAIHWNEAQSFSVPL